MVVLNKYSIVSLYDLVGLVILLRTAKMCTKMKNGTRTQTETAG